MSHIINASWNIRVEDDKTGFIGMTYVYFPGLYESVYEATNPLLLHSLRRLEVFRRGGLMQNTAESLHPRKPVRRHSIVSYILTALIGSLIGIIVLLAVFPQFFSVRSVWTPQNPPLRPSVASVLPVDPSGSQEALASANDEATFSRRTAIAVS